VNRYRYALNNPVLYIDPTGLFTVKPTQYLPALNGNVTGFGRGTFSPTAGNLAYSNFDAPVSTSTWNVAANSLANGGYSVLKNYTSSFTRAAVASGVSLAASIPLVGQIRGPSNDDGYVRELVPNVPIVPTRPEDLPLYIQRERSRSDTYQLPIVSHQGQGYFVPGRDGSVQFVTDEAVLPIATRLHQAGNAAQDARHRAAFLTAVQEGLIAISPAHETARDIGVAGFNYDYAEPNLRFSTEDRANAAFFLAMPGGNSGQMRRADDILNFVRPPRNRADAIIQDLLEQPGVRAGRTIPGVRPGAPGHPDHLLKISELEQRALLEAAPGETVLVQRQIQNRQSSRIPDVQIVDRLGRTRKVFEAERAPNSRYNAEREVEYRKLGIPFETHPLD
jgi:hypothetical protein